MISRINFIKIITFYLYTPTKLNNDNFSVEEVFNFDIVFSKYLNNIKILLQNRLTILNKRHNKTNEIETKQINKILTSISIVEKTVALSDFVDQIYDLYVEKVSNTGNVFPGIGKRLTYIINKIENDELEGLEAINELQYYKETIDLYSNELENLLTFYESNFENTKSEEGSLLWKLNKIKELVEK